LAPLADRSLVFIGFMGAGKSSAIKAARAAGLEALDTDELLERELGMPIDEFFSAHGEAEFRRREGEFESALLDRTDGAAIALGGGSVLSESVRTALARHVVVWLELDTATAWERVEGKGERPLAHDRERFEALLAERVPFYESLADAVVPGSREVVKRALPALRGLLELPAGTRLAWARSSSGEYPALVGRGLLGSHPFGPIVRHGGLPELSGRTFTVTDARVPGMYADAVEPAEARIARPPGETAKPLGEAERVLREHARAGMTRSDHLVAVGGGVVGDLAGFCAATYQRGVPVVQVPTTLVAQVDSAYGGKTGVDLPEGKNYAGAYHQPAAVLADPDTLTTLPAEELAAGFVEVLKTALIAGGALWERVRTIEALDPAELDEVIFACVRKKLAIVAADERDSGRRQVLNLGHTVGHAIEAATGYSRYRHGEAVGLGLLAALRLSGADGLRAEVQALLARCGLPTTLHDSITTDAVLEAVERDKKRTAEGVPFVLLERPGDAVAGRQVEPSRVREAVEELRRG
jgi:shikimate kinase / 3-dehydroquinate synthase